MLGRVVPAADLRTTRSRPKLRRLLRRQACGLRLPCFIERSDTAARPVLTVVALGEDQRFVELAATIADARGLGIEIVGIVSPITPKLPPDVLESSGAAALSRRFERSTGTRPEWEVLHGRRAATAIERYVASRRPALVALAHRAHRRGARCEAIDIASRLTCSLVLI